MKHKSSEKKGYQNVRNREMFVLWRGIRTQVSTLKNCLHKEVGIARSLVS